MRDLCGWGQAALMWLPIHAATQHAHCWDMTAGMPYITAAALYACCLHCCDHDLDLGCHTWCHLPSFVRLCLSRRVAVSYIRSGVSGA
jgi:hypothetical protein